MEADKTQDLFLNLILNRVIHHILIVPPLGEKYLFLVFLGVYLGFLEETWSSCEFLEDLRSHAHLAYLRLLLSSLDAIWFIFMFVLNLSME